MKPKAIYGRTNYADPEACGERVSVSELCREYGMGSATFAIGVASMRALMLRSYD